MAERTSIPHIDNLLAEFAAGYYVRPAGSIESYDSEEEWLRESGYTEADVHHWEEEAWGPGTGRYPYVKDPVSELRNRHLAEGSCDHVARSLTEFLRSRSVLAYNNCGDPHPDDPRMRSILSGELDALGYADRPTQDTLFDSHSLVVIRNRRSYDDEGEVYTIDFAASQYGYAEFPLVQKHEEGAWVRDWPALHPRPIHPYTHDAKIDQLIHQFKQECYGAATGQFFNHPDGKPSWYEAIVYYYEDMDKELHADGACFWVARDFAQYLRNHGMQATVCGHVMDHVPMDKPWRDMQDSDLIWDKSVSNATNPTPEGFGYDDRTIDGHEEHYWVEVKGHHGQLFGIDFTAVQYGYDVSPMVQHYNLHQGRWIREPLIVERDPQTGLPQNLHIERYGDSGLVHYNAYLVDQDGNYTEVDVGVLSIHALPGGGGGTIAGIEIEPGFQRMGVATAMLDQAILDLGPIAHDQILSADAQAWISYLDMREHKAPDLRSLDTLPPDRAAAELERRHEEGIAHG